MKLITSNNNDCVAASLAMLFDVAIGYVKNNLFVDLPKPFTGQWRNFPKVPDMNVICDWAWQRRTALVPFEYNPQCTPHKDCPAAPVYPTLYSTSCHTVGRVTSSPDIVFNAQMACGPGLIEGIITGREVGHMCAWDGKIIYDPRGYCYSPNVAPAKFNYRVTRFWLAVKGKI